MLSSLCNSLLISSLSSFSFLARAQTVVTSAFDLRPSGSRSQQVVSLGDSKSQVIQVLGPPTKTSRFYAEIDKAWWPVLHYGANQLFFSGKRLAIIKLNDAHLTVGEPGKPSFRVGSQLPQPTAKPMLAFSRFNVERKPGKAHNLSYQLRQYENHERPNDRCGLRDFIRLTGPCIAHLSRRNLRLTAPPGHNKAPARAEASRGWK